MNPHRHFYKPVRVMHQTTSESVCSSPGKQTKIKESYKAGGFPTLTGNKMAKKRLILDVLFFFPVSLRESKEHVPAGALPCVLTFQSPEKMTL